jgi:hypothetical protein
MDIAKIKDPEDGEDVQWCPRTSMREYCKLMSEQQLLRMVKLMEIIEKTDEGRYHLTPSDADEINQALINLRGEYMVDVYAIAEEYRANHPGAIEHIQPENTEA